MRDGWVETTLGDVAQIQNGKYLPKSEYVDEGRFLIFGSNSIMGSHDKFTVEPPHVVMAAVGANAGKVRYSPEPSWVNNNAFALVTDVSQVGPNFLYLWLSTSLDLSQTVGGTGQPYVQRPQLLSQRITLPPLAEQRRIVDVIESVDAYIAALEKRAEAARTARSALLHHLLSNPGPDWVETTLGEVAEWFSGGTPRAGNADFYENGTIPWAVIADMAAPILRSTATRITAAGLAAIGGRTAPPGSVLVSMYASVGKSSITEIELATNQAIAWGIPASGRIESKFLFYALQQLERAIRELARGATQRNINRGMLREFEIVLPPMEQQRSIAEVIESVDSKIAALDESVDSARDLRGALLSDLLSGNHEIPASYDELLGAA